ncbi:MAG TPA: NAD(P)H-quinone oxidoreductase [Myxococcales bacterium]|nr:NAD(P)H-quinone oxidoreductase [Myxococcales bacterium]
MRAIVVKQPGGPEMLMMGEIPDPQPREGDLIVRVRAAGVNRADLLQRLGRYPAPKGEPDTIGLEIAGEVEHSAGSFPRGARVMALLGGGGYAEKARVPAAQAIPIPGKLSFEEAAAIPEAFLTSWLNLAILGALQPGQVVVVHAAASGVGTAALQICRGIASVILATASSSKHQTCRALGATHVLARDEVPTRLAEAVREASGGHGADIIFDLVGGAYFEANISALALQGKLCCISTMGGTRATLDLGALLGRRLSVLGSTLRSRSAEQKARLTADFIARVLPRFESGELKPVLSKTYPLAEAAKAHEDLQADRVVGKIVLIP